MARSARNDGTRYPLRFAATILIVLAAVLLLVLYVFPERYVFDAGFRESGRNVADPVTPFTLDPVRRIAARPLPEPRPDPEPEPHPGPGPAERLWDELLPLIGQERHDEAAALLRSYLTDYPGDRSARSELAFVLLRAGRPDAAVEELRTLLQDGGPPQVRLQLARTLRDIDRTDEAAAQFRVLAESHPENTAYWLDWARTWAWAERYPEAAAVLEDALDRHPESVALRVETARVRFAMDELEPASRALEGVSDQALAEAGAPDLREALLEAMAVPAPPVAPPPTLFEQALQAREDDEFDRSADLLRQALVEQPEDAEIWQALANLREYELEDFAGARSALLEVERIDEDLRPALQLRIARLESWLDMTDQARGRLAALLPVVEGRNPAAAADAYSILGDLARWEGDRPAAAEEYALALEADSTEDQARRGLELLDTDVERDIRAEERPGASALSYLGADTDDFVRLDVGGQWIRVADEWVFGGTAGSRFVDGLGLVGEPADARRGFFADVEGARWWRYGTIRTGIELGVQDLADEFDYSAALSVGLRGARGSRVGVRYSHGPAYLTTATLQSLIAGVVQDVVQVTLSRPVGDDWGIAADAGVSWLRAELDAIPEARNEKTVRLELATTLSRRLSETFSVGVSTEVLGYTDAGPVVSGGPGVDRRLYWDPRLFVSAQPFVGLDRDLPGPWSLTGRIAAGVAFVDDRPLDGGRTTPQLAAEMGIRRDGERYGISLDLFTSQGRFGGYRLYGLRFGITPTTAREDVDTEGFR